MRDKRTMQKLLLAHRQQTASKPAQPSANSRMVVEDPESPAGAKAPIGSGTGTGGYERSTAPLFSSSQKRMEGEAAASREGQFWASYGESAAIFRAVPDLQNTLARSKIERRSRAKMVDWMLEVLQSLQPEFGLSTLFRAVLLMDLFTKLTRERLGDEDIHLLGIASMYVGSKYEDTRSIRVGVFCEKAAHGKFSPAELRRREADLLEALSYALSFTSLPDLADFYLSRLLGGASGLVETGLAGLRRTAHFFLAFCIHEVGFNNRPPHLLVVACVINAVKYLCAAEQAQLDQVGGKPRAEGPHEGLVLRGLLELVEREEKMGLEMLVGEVRAFLVNFERVFPDFKQLVKLSAFQRVFLL